MNKQINLRIPETILNSAQIYSQKHGFSTVQELIKELLREKLFEPEMTEKELILVEKLIKAGKEKNLYRGEKELLKKLRE